MNNVFSLFVGKVKTKFTSAARSEITVKKVAAHTIIRNSPVLGDIFVREEYDPGTMVFSLDELI